ncbi:hypothetical protein F5Y00DRAFT_261480 [Daldinia vernicosa]|uniref:uncharacterized protein n=1 Tax=Daldinia vernicosa TaxID=114800 RepID=UPI00200807E6|nr:uncharacterized protein F5Y00DRAFT_261480 [Daldinia vernicosa]KAI0849342.1 hypothetical protein F5Y00DRAFT_261480 [Daldinia vernicosa]
MERVHPSVVVGHSSGDIAAAYAVGRLSYRTALSLTAFYRGFMSAASKNRVLPAERHVEQHAGEAPRTVARRLSRGGTKQYGNNAVFPRGTLDLSSETRSLF